MRSALGALAAIGLVAAGIAAPASAEEINLWARTSTASFLQPLVKSYNDTHPDKVNLTLVTAEQMVPKLGAAIAGGAAPEVAVLDLIYVPAFAASGQLQDMTDFVNGLPFAKALSPSHIRLATYEGKIYGVPMAPDASMFAYNKKLFREAGLDPEKAPASLEEIAIDAEKISALGEGKKGFFFVASSGSWLVYDFMPHVWAAGDDVLSADGRTATIDTKGMRDTIALYQRMWKNGAVHPASRSGNGSDAVAAFASGKVGILMTGSYIVNLMTQKYPAVEFGIAPIPGPTGNWSTFAGGDTLALIKGTSETKKKVVEDFVNYYMEPKQEALITKESGMPPRTDLAKEVYASFDPRNLIAYDALKRGRTPYTYASDELFVSRTGFGGDVDSAIAKAQADFTKILERTDPKE
jgi:multiple sugar transport system substrate-binding protein